MKIKVGIFFLFFLGQLASVCYSQDKEFAPKEVLPLDRFVEVFSVEKFVADIATEITATLAPAKKDEFINKFKKEIDTDEIEQIFRRELRKTYTDAELNALSELCATKEGRSALQKYAKCMENVMAGIQGEVMRTRKKILSTEVKE